MIATKAVKIEQGVWYEPARGRYRVRLYHKGRVVYLSYHTTEEEALEALQEAREKQYVIRANYKEPEPIPPTLENLLNLVKTT